MMTSDIAAQAWAEGWHYWQRVYSAQNLPSRGVQHCIVFVDPYNCDAPLRVRRPAPSCVAELMAGGVHPPIEAIHKRRLELVTDSGEHIECTWLEAPRIRATHRIKAETVIDDSAEHLAVAMPMTYEQAIEWIAKKDVPFEAWGRKHNRRMFAIVPRESIPTDRAYRDAWKLTELAA